jgi:hypothetical protein
LEQNIHKEVELGNAKGNKEQTRNKRKLGDIISPRYAEMSKQEKQKCKKLKRKTKSRCKTKIKRKEVTEANAKRRKVEKYNSKKKIQRLVRP